MKKLRGPQAVYRWAAGLGVVLQMGLGSALADGFRNPPDGAAAIGRIGGKIAQEQNVSAVFLNPANLAALDQWEAQAALTLGYGRKEFQSAAGPVARSRSPWSYLPSLFAATPLGADGWVGGIGVNVPFGRFTDYGSNAFFGELTPYYSSLRVIQVNPVLVKAVHENLALAVGVSGYTSDLEFKYRPGIRFKGDGQGFGYNAAATWTPAPGHRLAMTYRAGFDLEYDGDLTLRQLPPGAEAFGATPRSDFETEFRFPAMAALGYGYQLTQALSVEIGVEWIEHSRNRAFTVDANNNNLLLNVPPSPAPLQVPQDWQDNWTVGLGLEWQCAPAWRLRAGYIFLETPTPAATTIPVTAEQDQHVVSVGAGYTWGSQSFDLGYAYGITPDRRIAVGSPLDGEYSFEAHLLSLSYGLRF